MINEKKENSLDNEEINENKIIEVKGEDSKDNEKNSDNKNNDIQDEENKINEEKSNIIENDENKNNDDFVENKIISQKNDDIIENNENIINIIEKDEGNIDEHNNINKVKIDEVQEMNIVENTDGQINDISTDDTKDRNIINIIQKDNIEVNDNLHINSKNDSIENDGNKISENNEIIINDAHVEKKINNDIKDDMTENDGNKINNIPQENKEDLIKKKEISEEELKQLSRIIFYQTIFNNKKTKINEQKDYEFIIEIINKLKEKEFELFFRYLHDINIPLFKIIVNGFIEFNFNDENKEKNLLDIISRVISLFLNKKFFYFIYKKLSKYYRKHYKIENIESIKKFEKIFKVWKLLYNPLSIKSFYENNDNFIIFFSKLYNKSKNIIIDIDNEGNFFIDINFYSFPILDINKNISNFYFFIFYKDETKVYIKYDDVLSNTNNSDITCFSKIKEIRFTFILNDCNIYFNGSNEIVKNIKFEFNFNSTQKLEILNNFIGYVSSIDIAHEKVDILESGVVIKNRYEVKIHNNSNNQLEYKIVHNDFGLESNEEPKFKKSEETFSKEIINLNCNNNKYMTKEKKNLNKIKNIGGFESFIPLFKILNNLISELETIISAKNEKENDNVNDKKERLNHYINKTLGWIKDIIKIMLKMICLSESNYQNFKKIIIPLLGSFSEIYQTLISSKGLDLKNYITNLFNNEVFFILYIIILNQNIPNNIKNAFGHIFGIKQNFNDFNFTMEPLIFNLKENKIKNVDWYYFIIFYFIEFFLLYYDSKEKVPPKLEEQLNLILKEENLLNNVGLKIKEMMKFLNIFIKKFDTNKKENIKESIGKNKILKKYIIYMIKIFFNVETMKEKENKINEYLNIFIDFLVNLSKNIEKNEINFQENDKIVINNFKYYKNKFQFLKSLYDFLDEKDFISENNLLLEEIIDYKKPYHHLMKELFIFNRLWSDQKLFFKNKSDEIKESKLKYKNINYYTKNFQKPIIYPFLDYQNHYPEFSKFNINGNLFKDDSENTDVYNFDLDCEELDKFIQERNNNIFEEISKKEEIKMKNVCLIKQQYHVKGNFFLLKNSDDSFSIYFYSFPFENQNNYKIHPNCNKKIKDEKKSFKGNDSKLCYGSIFKCPKKDCNRKIVLNSDDIRLIMKRIYFYRKSSIEIFTNTKAYYFNFEDEETMENIFNIISQIYKNNYLHITKENKIFGLLKINSKILQSYSQKGSNLIKGHISKGQFFEMSTFDLILFLNLISNRSFNDLHQYPVFPLLFF